MAVEIELTDDEALVLFDFVSRYTDTDTLVIQDQSEQRALWNLCACLERILVQPFQPDYRELLSQARERLRDEIDNASS